MTLLYLNNIFCSVIRICSSLLCLRDMSTVNNSSISCFLFSAILYGIYKIGTIINIAITIFLYGVLGFIDDILIVIKKNNNGIPAIIKLILQIIIAGISFALCAG